MSRKLAYYNDNDRGAIEWIGRLMKAGLIPEGDIDDRSIKDVCANEIEGYTQYHFFSGICGWSCALQFAGWPKDRPIITCSVPCQPYSAAGKGLGDKDPRDLWPDAFRLIRELKIPTIVGEQVPGAIKHLWLDRVFADLEEEGYACGAVVLTSSGVGAPNIRQRIYWAAYDNNAFKRTRVHGRRIGLSSNISMEMDGEQQGIPVSYNTQWQNFDASLFNRSGAWGDCGPYQPESAGQSTIKPPQSNSVGEQSQQKVPFGRGLPAKRENQMASISMGKQAIPMAWIVCDERGSDCCEEKCNGKGGGCSCFRLAHSNASGSIWRPETTRREERASTRATDGCDACAECRAPSCEPAYCGMADADREHGDRAGSLPGYDSRKREGSEGLCGVDIDGRLANTSSPEFRCLSSTGEKQADNGYGEACCRMGNTGCQGLERRESFTGNDGSQQPAFERTGYAVGGMGNATSTRLEACGEQPWSCENARSFIDPASPLGFWSDYRLIECRDGKTRRIPYEAQSEVQLMAPGLPAGVDRLFPLAPRMKGHAAMLKGVGNAINVQVAAEFIRSFMEVMEIKDARH